jgi:signal transduction histidine kinase/ActR/RegA family two-component response regulator
LKESLPFFNWSLRKLLATESDSFNRARLKILYVFLLVSVLKIAVVLPAVWHSAQDIQIIRALFLLAANLTLFKIMLANRLSLAVVTHILIVIGMMVVGSNIYLVAQQVNIMTLQFVFMIILSSFYLLEMKYSLLYSSISISLVLGFLFLTGGNTLQMSITAQEIPFSAGMIITVLNFFTIIGAHYLYHQAFDINLAEKVSLNKQLQVAVEQANSNAQSKTVFLSTMSHELRTPLNSVIGMTHLLMQNPVSEEQKKNLEVLRFSAESLRILINDILDYNKFNSEKTELEQVSVNLFNLISNICSGLELQAKEKGLSIFMQVDDALKTQNVFTDPMRITQVIYNLVGNGIKFTNQGHIKVSLTITEQNEQRLKIHFAVQDTGIGISAEKHAEVFEPFIQESLHTARRYGGTGLGLTIVKRLLTLFGSEIHLESASGKGSKFYFDISFISDYSSVSLNGTENIVQRDELSGLRILIAEDNRLNLLLVEKLAQRWNIELHKAENSADVLQLLQTNAYDAILMDIHLPDMDGYEITKSIRNLPDKQKAATPVIALTATSLNELYKNLDEAGINDYVMKPFNADELYNKLKKISNREVAAHT